MPRTKPSGRPTLKAFSGRTGSPGIVTKPSGPTKYDAVTILVEPTTSSVLSTRVSTGEKASEPTLRPRDNPGPLATAVSEPTSPSGAGAVRRVPGRLIFTIGSP